jgi:hypothetical protein
MRYAYIERAESAKNQRSRMRKSQSPRQLASRLNAIGPRRKKEEIDKIEGLARSIALRIRQDKPVPPGYKRDWGFVIMQFYRPVNQAHNLLKRQLRNLGK